MNMKPMASLALAIVTGLTGSAALAGPANDTLNVVFTRESDYLDQIHASSVESDVYTQLLYDTLVRVDRQTLEFKPSLASAWTWLDDTTVEFTIRDGVTFHNGEDLTAEDVVYTFELLMDADNKFRQQRSDFGMIESAGITDEGKVRVTLSTPTPTFEVTLASRVPIFPKDYTSEHGVGIHQSEPVGSGPYMLEDMQMGSSYTFVKFPDYDDTMRPAGEIGTISVRIIPEVQTQIAELMAGNVDLSLSLSPADAEALAGMPGLSVQTGPATRLYWLSMNVHDQEDNPLADADVRRAISYAVNRQELTASLISPDAAVLTAQCNPVQPLCPDDISPVYSYDPEKAKELLAAAGYADGLTLNLMAEASLRPVCEAIQGYLSEVGITVNLDTFPLPAWRDRFIGGESQMSVLGWGSGISTYDISRSLGIFFNGAPTDYVKDQEVIDLTEEAAGLADAAKREVLYDRVLSKINAEAYTLPLYGLVAVYVSSDDVEFDPPALESVDLATVRWAE